MTGCPREQLLALFTQAPNAVWRHDIDVSLNAACQMARFAELAGVTSTFYLMLRGEHYNLLSPEGERAIATIIEHGHHIGLHVNHRSGDPVDTAHADIDLADHAWPNVFHGYDTATRTRREPHVSFHMPRLSVLWRDFPTFENAYAAKWEGRYVSDSRGEWTAEKAARVTGDMQISLHPEHWFA